MNPDACKLSIVVASRHDDHGGGMLERMRWFIRGLDHQVRQFGMPVELVFVEWNPPEDMTRLHAVLPRPQAGSPLRIRYVTVPESVHRRWRHAEVIPLFQMIAKNVGIRRSRGEFVLCTNIDLLLSDPLCGFLAAGKLDPGAFYRANRCDVPRDILAADSPASALVYASAHVIRRLGDVPWGYGKSFASVRRLKRAMIQWFQPDTRDLIHRLDTDACGDFTLMAKSAWERIRGYPELGLYSIHDDTLGCMAAAACGYRQVVLPPELCTYHIDHDSGWMSMTPAEKLKFSEQRPTLDWMVICESARWMLEHQQPLPVNDAHWGCLGEDFEEQVIGG